MRYGYCRVSSVDQTIRGLSIDSQVQKLKALGIDEKNIYVDSGRSAGVKEDAVEYIYDGRHFITKVDLNVRPAFRDMMNILVAGDELHFTKWDRLSRSVHFLDVFVDWCERQGVVLCPIEDSSDRLVRKITAVISEEELYKTASRNDSIFKSAYEKGLFPFKPPIGYNKNIKKPDLTLTYPDLPESELVVDLKAMSMVLDIFKLMADSIYYKDICEKYDINNTTLYNIVRNKTYLGMTHFTDDDWKKTPHVPQVITEELFEKANKNIKTKTK
jgi:DNA invertase Pin-like site-specific DNA recombinase